MQISFFCRTQMIISSPILAQNLLKQHVLEEDSFFAKLRHF